MRVISYFSVIMIVALITMVLIIVEVTVNISTSFMQLGWSSRRQKQAELAAQIQRQQTFASRKCAT